MEAPTIARFAEMLRAGELSSNCLVPIKESGSRAAFYCVHGIGGNVLELRDLARRVHIDQPFYGIQAIGLSGTQPNRKYTVEEMAEHYINDIRKLQPAGPYHLGGSSFGGLVAFEMARQLTAAGHEVALVAMFDTSAPGSLNSHDAARSWRRNLDTFSYGLSLHWHNIWVLDAAERKSYISQKLRRIVTSMRERSNLPTTLRSVSEALHWAQSRYVPQEYSGSITLFRATKQPSWIVSNRTLGWESVVKGGIEVYDTPGHHADLVRDPRARVLARQLDDALLRARSVSTRRAAATYGSGV